MCSLRHYIKEVEGKMYWKLLHSEKRNSMSANCDCLNHVKVAGLVDFDINCKYEFVQVQVENAMNSFKLSHSLNLNMKDGITL